MNTLSEQIAQSQSVGNLPMPRSNSRLDTINEANHETPYEFGSLNYENSGSGLPAKQATIP